MIVKNEAHVIERCLSAVRPHVDHWVIVDTGSTDGTQDLIRRLMADVPGELLERPWVDFGHNRSQSLAAARPRADYTFVIDADEVLELPPGFTWAGLHGDAVMIDVQLGPFTYRRTALVANRLPWQYNGVLHEYLEAPDAGPNQILLGPRVIVHYDGARSQGRSTAEKYAADARTLEQALVGEPDNTRYQYYLARSYLNSDQPGPALAAFRKRAEMGGFAEEVADSLLDVARLLERFGLDFDTVHRAYLAAWESRPARAEPLYELARYCRTQQRFAIGRMAAWQAMFIPRPDDLLWVNDEVYTWRSLDEYAIAAYWTDRFAESELACRKLLEGDALPAEHRGRVQANLDFARAALGRAAGSGTIPGQTRGAAVAT